MNSWSIVAEVRRRVEAEHGTLRKQASLPVALCYPSKYSVGMSSLGFQTIYREIHLSSHASAERAFLPERPAEYRMARTPVFTYESEKALNDFPIVAFSVSYELEIPGLLEMLDLCGIPVLAGDRSVRYPLVIAGGPLTNSNPVPLAPFVDLIVLGEGEDVIHEILDAAVSMQRAELLDFCSTLPG
jgi:radical SAM superfamily enzyme YgiQ (UPF0313 family)